MEYNRWNIRIRQAIVMGCLILIFFLWFVPVGTLASLLSYEEIKKAAPWLGRFIDLNDTLRNLVQTTLPSIAIISLNGLLPFLLEGEHDLGLLETTFFPDKIYQRCHILRALKQEAGLNMRY